MVKEEQDSVKVEDEARPERSAQDDSPDHDGLDHDNPGYEAISVYMKEFAPTPEQRRLYGALAYAYYQSTVDDHPTTSFVRHEFGRFLALQVKLSKAKNVLEVGTLAGHATMCMALVDQEIKVTTISIDLKYMEFALSHFRKARIEDRVEFLPAHGNAANALNPLATGISLGTRKPFDFVFINLDHQDLLTHYLLMLSCVEPGTPIIINNRAQNDQEINSNTNVKQSEFQQAGFLVQQIGMMSNVEAVALRNVDGNLYGGYIVAISR